MMKAATKFLLVGGVLLAGFFVVAVPAVSAQQVEPTTVRDISVSMNAEQTALYVSGYGDRGCVAPCRMRVPDTLDASVHYVVFTPSNQTVHTGPDVYYPQEGPYRWHYRSFGGATTSGADVVNIASWIRGTYRICMTATGGINPMLYPYGDPGTYPATRCTSFEITRNDQPPVTPGWSMSCPVVTQTAQQGGQAQYSVFVTSAGGYTGSVTVTPSGLPTGASSSPQVVVVPPNGTAAAIMNVALSSSTPAGTSTLTFTATADGHPSRDCQSQLVVTATPASVAAVSISANPSTLDAGQDTELTWVTEAANSCERQAFPAHAGWSGVMTGVQVSDGPHVQPGVTVSTSTTFRVRCENEGIFTPWAEAVVTVNSGPIGGSFGVLLEGSTTSVWSAWISAGVPLSGLNLRATLQNPSGQPYIYTYYCDRADAGTNVTPGYAVRTGSLAAVQHTASGACSYPDAGTYTAKVIGERASGAPVEDRMLVTLTDVQAQNDCTFRASPSSIFIPPLRSTTLSWDCAQPASCMVANLENGVTVAAGGQMGSGQDSPRFTSTYRLNCDGAIQDLTVRVFDVTTRVEILPN
jgi:hypothetical protein